MVYLYKYFMYIKTVSCVLCYKIRTQMQTRKQEALIIKLMENKTKKAKKCKKKHKN